ncbi:MAG: OsmC family protein [Deltaproteobacteria bacterium]|nr:OsmC family protein [Deltaproteobacteria bacterium]
MMGTLAKVLAEKKIRTHRDLFTADVAGDIEDVDGILKITRIHVHYRLRADVSKKEAAHEALNNYLSKCPAAQSVIGCIRVSHDLAVTDMPKN